MMVATCGGEYEVRIGIILYHIFLFHRHALRQNKE